MDGGGKWRGEVGVAGLVVVDSSYVRRDDRVRQTKFLVGERDQEAIDRGSVS